MKDIKLKLYCYVDESGQDTKGDIFVVSIVITGKEKDVLSKEGEDMKKLFKEAIKEGSLIEV